jgi:hypothetical protein
MADNATTQKQPRSPVPETEPQASQRWYFICPSCNAKWFHCLSRHPCPRCERTVSAGARVVPPWRQ